MDREGERERVAVECKVFGRRVLGAREKTVRCMGRRSGKQGGRSAHREQEEGTIS